MTRKQPKAKTRKRSEPIDIAAITREVVEQVAERDMAHLVKSGLQSPQTPLPMPHIAAFPKGFKNLGTTVAGVVSSGEGLMHCRMLAAVLHAMAKELKDHGITTPFSVHYDGLAIPNVTFSFELDDHVSDRWFNGPRKN